MPSIWAVLIPPSRAVSVDANNRIARSLNLSEAAMERQFTVEAIGALFKREHPSFQKGAGCIIPFCDFRTCKVSELPQPVLAIRRPFRGECVVAAAFKQYAAYRSYSSDLSFSGVVMISSQGFRNGFFPSIEQSKVKTNQSREA
jgi:hypothetical protein